MPYSSGSFSLTSGNPVVTGTTISSTWANNTLSDIATGLSTAMLKDGSQTLTANIPFGGFQITGLGAGTAATDGATVAQTQNGASSALTSVSGTNTIVGTASPTPSAYAVGQRFWFVPANTNTGATTLNVSSLGAGAVQWNGAALVGGEIRQNVAVQVYVSATTPVFQLIGSAAMLNGYSVPSNVFTLQDNSDRTKQLTFVLSGITTATTRTLTMPDANINLVYSQQATTSLAGAAEWATQAEADAGTASRVATTDLNKITLGTPTATTSGTAITLGSGLPTGIRELKINFVGVSSNGSSPIIVQLSQSATFATSGYSCVTAGATSAALSVAVAQTTGFAWEPSGGASVVRHGTMTLTLQNSSTNTWAMSVTMGDTGGTFATFGGGSVSLSGALDGVRITAVNGTDTFDAGAANITYER